MTFLFGTNVELLYSMPAIGATQAASTATLLSGNSGTNPPFQLPALGNIWPVSGMVGRGLMFLASGGYSTATNSVATTLQLDGTVGTQGAGSITLATSGLVSAAAGSTGAWQAQCWLTCVSTGTASTWYSTGDIMTGLGAGETAAGATYMWGGPTITNGIPVSVTIPTTVPYFVDIYAKWTTAIAANVCTQFLIFGLD